MNCQGALAATIVAAGAFYIVNGWLGVKRHFLSGVNGGLQSVTVESNGILYSQAAGCQQYNGMFS